MFLGIEIGGTKLQLGTGDGDGNIRALHRSAVDPSEGSGGILKSIAAGVDELLNGADRPRGVGIGFGGPTDDVTQSVITSHQIGGWDGFPLAEWISKRVAAPAVVCNDADMAGLGEALFGAGRGLSPIFYITLGTGIGGSLIIDGQIHRGAGRGAAEIGHLRIRHPGMHYSNRAVTVEESASGPGIAAQAVLAERNGGDLAVIRGHSPDGKLTAQSVAAAARAGDRAALAILDSAWHGLAEGICSVIALVCPQRIVIGGGVSLMGDELLFEPLRRQVAERVFRPFAGLTDIVPAALGEEVVVHGALAMARRKFGK